MYCKLFICCITTQYLQKEIQQRIEAVKKDLADVNDKMKEWIQ